MAGVRPSLDLQRIVRRTHATLRRDAGESRREVRCKHDRLFKRASSRSEKTNLADDRQPRAFSRRMRPAGKALLLSAAMTTPARKRGSSSACEEHHIERV
jgi:hypothetical protein